VANFRRACTFSPGWVGDATARWVAAARSGREVLVQRRERRFYLSARRPAFRSRPVIRKGGNMVRLLIGSRRDVIRLAVLVVLGLTLPLVTGMSSAAGSPAPASISIAPKAYVYNSGLRLEAQVTIQCTGGIGNVFMQVTQTAAQSSNGLGASGSQLV